MKLQIKILLVLAPLVTAPLVALSWTSFVSQRARLESETLARMSLQTTEVARNVRSEFQVARSNIQLFAQSAILKSYLLIEDEAQRYRLHQPKLIKLFSNYQRAYPNYIELRIILPDGYEDTRSTLTPIPNSTDEEFDTEYFQVIHRSKDDVTTQIVHNADTDSPVLMVGHRLAFTNPSVDPVLAKPKLRGYLLVTMSLDFLKGIERKSFPGSESQLVFLGANAEPLFKGDESNSTIVFSREQIDVANNSEQLGKVMHNEHTMLVHAEPINEALTVAVAISQDEILDSIWRIATIAIAIALITILLTTTTLFGFLRWLLLRPLAQIIRVAEDIGGGDLTAKISLERNDEIGTLAKALSTMGVSLKRSHDQISHMAYHDHLTGLPNRNMFSELLERVVARAKKNNEMAALMFIDVDDFKRINDTLGHQVGDVLLREVSKRLTTAVRITDNTYAIRESSIGNTVARIGGDEFIVLLPNIEYEYQAGAVAERLLERLTQPYMVDDNVLHVGISVGITIYPNDGDSAQALIKSADIAMYHAKEKGKNRFQYYTETMNTALRQRVELESDLRQALDSDQLLLHYQPIVDIDANAIVAVEALARWRHPTQGMIPPDRFIPVAEETGLIAPLGAWVLRQACRQNKAWQEARLPPITISVNVSNRQFINEGFKAFVEGVLDETGLAAKYLKLEITESCIMTSSTDAMKTLAGLKELGLGIAMDDFGTGYSSLHMLKRLPIDSLKIDRSFIQGITTNEDDAAITSVIISMSKSMGLTVVAEGVEQQQQLAILKEQGCTVVQGYLLSRPVAEGSMAAMLNSAHGFCVDSPTKKIAKVVQFAHPALEAAD